MGKTILFVSHDLSSISKYCDRVFLLNQGTLLGEGSPKEMIDTYKRVLVGQYEIPDKPEDYQSLLNDEELKKAASEAAEGKGKRGKDGVADSNTGKNPNLNQNPSVLEYGTRQAEILEYYITDDRGVRTTAVLKGNEFTLHMQVSFADDIPAPIFAFSVKNVHGTEITGTNSMIEKAYLDGAKKGQLKNITFTQKMTLQGGEYLLSLGVTGYNGDTFEVYHRLYDALNITVVSDKNTVGYYDMESKVIVEEVERFRVVGE